MLCGSAAQHSVEGLLATLMKGLDQTFQATRFAAPLQALADAASVAADSPPAADALQSAFSSALAVLAPIFQVIRSLIPASQQMRSWYHRSTTLGTVICFHLRFCRSHCNAYRGHLEESVCTRHWQSSWSSLQSLPYQVVLLLRVVEWCRKGGAAFRKHLPSAMKQS